jgi:hypothetical protein
MRRRGALVAIVTQLLVFVWSAHDLGARDASTTQAEPAPTGDVDPPAELAALTAGDCGDWLSVCFIVDAIGETPVRHLKMAMSGLAR